MPSYNQGRYVEASIISLIEQDYAHKELIFIDGGSTDETMKIFEKYKKYFTHHVSEKDLGQSDALQKGFNRASGDVLTWLNSDDLLLPGALKAVKAEFVDKPYVECVFGNVVWIDSEDLVIQCRKGDRVHRFLQKLRRLSAFGPSAFFTADALKRVGGVNLDLHYTMDNELWWRFFIEGVKFSRVNEYTWAFRRHPKSKTSAYLFDESIEEAHNEVYRAERANLERLKREHCSRCPTSIGRLAELLSRGTSLQYMASLRDSRRYKGRPLESLVT